MEKKKWEQEIDALIKPDESLQKTKKEKVLDQANKIKTTITKMGKKEIVTKWRVPRWLTFIIIPSLFALVVVFLTDKSFQFDLFNGILRIPTFGMLGFEKVLKPTDIQTIDGTHILKWKSIADIRWAPKWLGQAVREEEGTKYVAQYLFMGTLFWGSLLAAIGSIGDSRKTSKLVNEFTLQEITERLRNNETVDQKEIKVIVEERILETEFWTKASLKNVNHNAFKLFLILPSVYIWIKKKMFTVGFISNEFNINWESCFANVNLNRKEETNGNSNKSRNETEIVD